MDRFVRADSVFTNGCKRAAAHVFLFSKAPSPSFISILRRADGLIGLPGGFVDPGESAEVAARRELQEEIGFELPAGASLQPLGVDKVYEAKGISLHLFTCEVENGALEEVARNWTRAQHFQSEIAGIMLVHREMLQGFLKHTFVANAREQLIYALSSQGLLPAEMSPPPH
mmetsp:Transcript_55344/g.130651  ORF Transcript_55344/g.130651 Transcript_55344/m.130651 type:complete len:171 (-) Transcript_55344:30-542(-)